MKKNNIYLWTGEGAGKTTSALGVSLRAVGHKKKVVVIQFMKGRKYIGEYKIMQKLKPYYQIFQFGSPNFIKPLTKPTKKDKELAARGLEFVRNVVKKKPHLLVLDEINLACAIGLVNIDVVVDLVKYCSDYTIVYLTGRKAPSKLKQVAGFVNEVKLLKSPKKYPVRKGIEW
ncbi:cob(I)yrinic acid a,c-diamide adenosyltransferase [Candidatus Woesearchaeota archaeon]|nr:cob(I)yrinic acid a,c-diamide adenosyltransferase [Candidatus Woesearchaeota archaeon]